MTVAEKWIKNLATIWTKQDVEAAVNLFAYCENYRESPFEENAANEKDGIRKLWLGVFEQSDIHVETKILMHTNESVLASYEAHYKMGDKPKHSKGIWLIKFEQDRCVSFEQWFMYPEI